MAHKLNGNGRSQEIGIERKKGRDRLVEWLEEIMDNHGSDASGVADDVQE